MMRDTLRDIAEATWNIMWGLADNPPGYGPSRKHADQEHVCFLLLQELAVRTRDLREAASRPMDSQAPTDPARAFRYFAPITGGQKQHLTAMRQAAQIKGALGSQLIRWVSDALRIVGDNVLEINTDCDLFIGAQDVNILRSSGFKSADQLQKAIAAGVSMNVAAHRSDLGFVTLKVIESYAGAHPRATRYLALTRSQTESRNIDHGCLARLCARTDIETAGARERIVVMGFLKVLDRRRYEIELVAGTPKQYRAANHSKPHTGAAP